MKRSLHSRLNKLSANAEVGYELPHFFHAAIYTDEDPKMCHTYGPKGEVISIPKKNLRKHCVRHST